VIELQRDEGDRHAGPFQSAKPVLSRGTLSDLSSHVPGSDYWREGALSKEKSVPFDVRHTLMASNGEMMPLELRRFGGRPRRSGPSGQVVLQNPLAEVLVPDPDGCVLPSTRRQLDPQGQRSPQLQYLQELPRFIPVPKRVSRASGLFAVNLNPGAAGGLPSRPVTSPSHTRRTCPKLQSVTVV
jgi:hypothetical protein